MNQYIVGLFRVNDAVEIRNQENNKLEDWLQWNAEAGYHLLSNQAVANDSGIYVLATMELDDETTRDPEPDTYLENYNAIAEDIDVQSRANAPHPSGL